MSDQAIRLEAEIERLYGELGRRRVALANAETENARLKAALQQSADWFQQYADGHTAKGATEKAARNQERANACRRALEGK